MMLTQCWVHIGQHYRQMVSVVSTDYMWVVFDWQGVFVFLCLCWTKSLWRHIGMPIQAFTKHTSSLTENTFFRSLIKDSHKNFHTPS